MKLIWTSDEFQHRKLQIYSLASSFILFCPQTSKVYQVDTRSFQIKLFIQLSMDCSLSAFISTDRLIFLSKDQTNILELDLCNSKLINQLSIQLSSSKVMQIYATYDHLVFHNDDKQIYLWEKDKQRLEQLNDALYLRLKHNRLVLVSTDNKTIVFHDLQSRSQQNGQLDVGGGSCEALCLSNINENDRKQYLFVICSDRLLRMYCVLTGEQMMKLFINKNLYPFLAIRNDCLLLKVADRLCIIEIIDQKSVSSR